MPPRPKSPVTTALIAINVAVFLAMVAKGVSPGLPTAAQLLPWGANWGPFSLGPQPWRMLVSNYLHGGILHLAMNMWCLWNLGFLAERIFGPLTYVLIYTASGLAGSLGTLWWHPSVPGVGASGAIFGLAGALIAALYLGHLPIPKEALRGTLKSLVAFAGYNLLFGAAIKVIDNAAHVGGLLGGLVLGAFLAKHLMAPPEIRSRWRRGAFVVAAVALMAGLAVVKRASGYVVPLEQGEEALQKSQFDTAARLFEQADTRKPNNRDTLFLLATAYNQKQDYAKAEKVLQHVLQIDPHDADARFNLGLAQLKLQKYADAIATLKAVVQLNPGDADAQQALGEAYQAKNMSAEARAAFQRSMDLRKAAKPK
jgi:membrane associated rhomboid family serine protease/Flp pilus assembly protein TadD